MNGRAQRSHYHGFAVLVECVVMFSWTWSQPPDTALSALTAYDDDDDDDDDIRMHTCSMLNFLDGEVFSLAYNRPSAR